MTPTSALTALALLLAGVLAVLGLRAANKWALR